MSTIKMRLVDAAIILAILLTAYGLNLLMWALAHERLARWA